MSALRTRLTREPKGATASTARRTTSMQAAQSPSIVVNIASVRLGSPDSRTTRTASATATDTESALPDGPEAERPSRAGPEGATEKATSTRRGYPGPLMTPSGPPTGRRDEARTPVTVPVQTDIRTDLGDRGGTGRTVTEGCMASRERSGHARRARVRLAAAVLGAATAVALLEGAALAAGGPLIGVLAGGVLLAVPLTFLLG